MNYITIIELAERSGTPGNSVILYLSMFEEFFREHKLVDGIKTIPEEKVDLVRAIHDLYHNQKMTKQEILDKVNLEYPWEIPKETDADSATQLGTKIDHLTQEMETLNTSGIMRLVQAVERLTDIAQALPEVLVSMTNHSTGNPGTDTVLDQLLTTRQDDQEDDPELMNLIKTVQSHEKNDHSLTFEPGDDETLSFDSLIDHVIELHHKGMDPSEIKSELKQWTGTSE